MLQQIFRITDYSTFLYNIPTQGDLIPKHPALCWQLHILQEGPERHQWCVLFILRLFMFEFHSTSLAIVANTSFVENGSIECVFWIYSLTDDFVTTDPARIISIGHNASIIQRGHHYIIIIISVWSSWSTGENWTHQIPRLCPRNDPRNLRPAALHSCNILRYTFI